MFFLHISICKLVKSNIHAYVTESERRLITQTDLQNGMVEECFRFTLRGKVNEQEEFT